MPSKKMIDVKKEAPAEATSKPVIVTNRPIMADPMVKPASGAPELEAVEKPKEARAPSASKIVIQPIAHNEDSEPENPVESETPEPKAEPAPHESEKPTELEQPAEAEDPEDTQLPAEATDKTDVEEDDPVEIERRAKLDALVESQKYFLPITTAEERKSRRTVVLGAILAIVLLLAWTNIAVDAGLISLPIDVPHTNFFSVK